MNAANEHTTLWNQALRELEATGDLSKEMRKKLEPFAYRASLGDRCPAHFYVRRDEDGAIRHVLDVDNRLDFSAEGWGDSMSPAARGHGWDDPSRTPEELVCGHWGTPVHPQTGKWVAMCKLYREIKGIQNPA